MKIVHKKYTTPFNVAISDNN